MPKADYEEKLSAKEAEEERLCDEERYMELSQDMTEFEIEQGTLKPSYSHLAADLSSLPVS